MARPQKCRCICEKPKVTGFIPQGYQDVSKVNLTYDEYEVIRLLDYVEMTQEECAVKMEVSRPTVTRIYNEARKKVADALEKIRPECDHIKHCCHRRKTLSEIGQ